MSTPVSKLVRDAIRERLADPTEGFTATHTLIAADYGVPALSVDFSGQSRQFFEGAVDIDDIMGSSPAKRPVLVLFTQSSINTVTQVGPLFSGQVTAVLQVHLDQRSGNAVRDYESPADAVEETLYRLFLVRDWSKPPEVTFGGDMSIQRGPVIPADTNWRQTITARLTFGAHIDE